LAAEIFTIADTEECSSWQSKAAIPTTTGDVRFASNSGRQHFDGIGLPLWYTYSGDLATAMRWRGLVGW